MTWFETALILLVNLIISFAAGCATRRDAYYEAAKNKPAMLIVLLAQYVFRPCTVMAVVNIMNLSDGARVGFLLCSMAPGGNGSNLLEIIYGGNIELGIVLTLFSSVAAMVAIPIIFLLLAARYTDDKFTVMTMPWGDLVAAVACVCVGAVAGAAVRFKYEQLGSFLEKRAAFVGIILLIAAVVFAVAQNASALNEITVRAWIAGLFPCPLTLLYTYAPARLLAGLSVKDARTVATEVGECNIGVAYAILLLLYSDPAARKPVFGGIVAYTVFNEIYIFSAAFYWRAHPAEDSKPCTRAAAIEMIGDVICDDERMIYTLNESAYNLFQRIPSGVNLISPTNASRAVDDEKTASCRTPPKSPETPNLPPNLPPISPGFAKRLSNNGMVVSASLDSLRSSDTVSIDCALEEKRPGLLPRRGSSERKRQAQRPKLPPRGFSSSAPGTMRPTEAKEQLDRPTEVKEQLDIEQAKPPP